MLGQVNTISSAKAPRPQPLFPTALTPWVNKQRAGKEVSVRNKSPQDLLKQNLRKLV